MEDTDIAIIGSGIAATLTLIEVFERLLKEEPPAKPIFICVIEKHHELWKGIPYGSRSSVNALTITSVYDFIYEPEHPAFFSWLKNNLGEWSSYYRQHGGVTAERWLQTNIPAIEREDWENIYIPRFLYGNYISEKFTGLLQKAEAKGLVALRTITAEATGIQPNGNSGYDISLSAGSAVSTHKVVIAAGSPPVRKMHETSRRGLLYVNDIYEPSVPGNLEALLKTLAETQEAPARNVLIIGSNASSLELLYILEGMPGMKRLVNRIVIISTSGLLPYHISTKTLDIHPVPNLDKIKEQGSYTIKTLSDAAAADILLAMSDGANMDYVATIISATLKMMEPLGEQARKEFFGIHALKLRDSFRRAGPEYRGVADTLLGAEHVQLLKGRFLGAANDVNGGATIQYIDSETGEEKTHLLEFSAIINCSGSDNLDRSSSQLLFNLINDGICKMNLSGKGIEVDEHFAAAPNLYVMGPLLGGNVNKLIHFWQLENASRLTYLAPFLAKELLEG